MKDGILIAHPGRSDESLIRTCYRKHEIILSSTRNSDPGVNGRELALKTFLGYTKDTHKADILALHFSLSRNFAPFTVIRMTNCLTD